MERSIITAVRNSQFLKIISGVSVSVLTFIGIKWLVSKCRHPNQKRILSEKRVDVIFNRIGINNIKAPELNKYELSVALQLVNTRVITVDDVSRLEVFRDRVIRPLQIQKKKFLSLSNILQKLIQHPKGVLLYGPPGSGKTTIAISIAKEAGARLIDLKITALTDQFYPDTGKLAGAVFSLARKLQPCIIFINKIDSFLRFGDILDLATSEEVKAEFLRSWDNVANHADSQIIVMGSTRKLHDVEASVLDRMDAKFPISLPLKRDMEDEKILDEHIERHFGNSSKCHQLQVPFALSTDFAVKERSHQIRLPVDNTSGQQDKTRDFSRQFLRESEDIGDGTCQDETKDYAIEFLRKTEDKEYYCQNISKLVWEKEELLKQNIKLNMTVRDLTQRIQRM